MVRPPRSTRYSTVSPAKLLAATVPSRLELSGAGCADSCTPSGRKPTVSSVPSRAHGGSRHWSWPHCVSIVPNPPGATTTTRPFEEVGASEKIGREGVGWPQVHVARRALLNQQPISDQRHRIRHRQRLELIVGDVQRRRFEAVREVFDLMPHLLAQLGVEIAQRLVEQQHGRLVGDRPRQRHALLLAAREQRRRTLRVAVQLDQAEGAHDLVLHDLARVFARAVLQGKGDVVEDGHVRPDGVALKDHANVTFVRRHQRRGRARKDHAGADLDLASGRRLEPGNAAQGARFATA